MPRRPRRCVWRAITFLPVLVVNLPLLGVAEDFIRLGDLLEFFLGIGRLVFVRVPFQGLLSVRFFDILVRGSFRNPQYFIIIFPHFPTPKTSSVLKKKRGGKAATRSRWTGAVGPKGKER